MTTIVFPGQGSQFMGMSKDFYDNFKIAKDTFDEIQEFVKINLKSVIFENKDNLLNSTNYTQICIFTASVVIFKTLISETNFDISKIKLNGTYNSSHSSNEQISGLVFNRSGSKLYYANFTFCV